MPVTIRCLIESKFAAVSQAVEFTAAAPTIIDKLTATNVSGVPVSFTAHLLPTTGGAANRNKMLSVTLRAGESYLCAELVGHVLDAGQRISTAAGAASSIAIRASGRERT